MNVRDFPTALEEAKQDTSVRYLFLRDKRTLKTVEGKFNHPYDVSASIDSVAQLFEDSFDTLSWTDSTVFDVSSLPIVGQLGRYRVTVVTRDLDRSVSITDGENNDVSFYVGMYR